MRLTARILGSAFMAFTLLVIGGSIVGGLYFYEGRMLSTFLFLTALTALIDRTWELVTRRRP